MNTRKQRLKALATKASACAIAALAAAAATTANADIIQETSDPFCEGFCLFPFGPNVAVEQYVAARFTPDQNYNLTQISVWFWDNNNFTIDLVTLSIETEITNTEGESFPSGIAIDTATFFPTGDFGEPILELAIFDTGALVEAGQNYYIVARSNHSIIAEPEDGPVWVVANGEPGLGWSTTTDFFTGEWQPAFYGGSFPAHILEGTPADGAPPCPCDHDSDGIQSIGDYFSYLTDFFAQLGGPGSADFDGDGEVTVSDYFQFLACLPDIAASTPCPN